MKTSSFSAIAIVPLALVLGFALGVYVITNNIPADLVTKSLVVILSAWVALIFLEASIRVVGSAFGVLDDKTRVDINVNTNTDDTDAWIESNPRKLIVYHVNKGEVIKRLETRGGYFRGVSDLRYRAQNHNILVKLGLAKDSIPVPQYQEPLSITPSGNDDNHQ